MSLQTCMSFLLKKNKSIKNDIYIYIYMVPIDLYMYFPTMETSSYVGYKILQ